MHVGPAASILLRKRLAEKNHSALRAMINLVRNSVLSPNRMCPDAFLVSDTRPIGGEYSGEGRPFAVFTGLQPDWQREQLDQVAEAFGFRPEDEIQIVAFCNRRPDHRVLGELSVRFAERFGGIVNFAGMLWPLVPPGSGIDILDPQWRQLEPHFRQMIEGMPGKVVSVRWEPYPGCESIIHVGDAAFARAWLAHSEFHMVK